jgi:hypothetical protein
MVTPSWFRRRKYCQKATMHQGAGQGRALAHPAAEGVDGAIGPLGQTHHLQHLAHSLAAGGTVDAGEEKEVLADR